MNRMTLSEVEHELPRWTILYDEQAGIWQAHSPSYDTDGILLEARNGRELIERVRALVQVLALAANRAGRLQPQGTLGGAWPAEQPAPPKRAVNGREGPRAVLQVTVAATKADRHGDRLSGAALHAMVRKPRMGKQDAKFMGYTGNVCTKCESLRMVRNGTCEKCLNCGASSGCS